MKSILIAAFLLAVTANANVLAGTEGKLLENRSDEALLGRWLPRLNDSSRNIREEAAKTISKIIIRNAAYRDELIPVIIEHCKTEESWPVVVNGVFATLYNFAPADPNSREQFLDLYIYLAKKSAYGVGDSAYRNIWRSIEKGYIGTDYKRLPHVLRLAKIGTDATNQEIRYYSVKILDWYADISN